MGQTRLKVGLFVTVSFFVLTGSLLWLAGSRFLQPVDTYIILFEESVSGLLPGAAVEYQGVTIGTVETLQLTQETPPRARVRIALQPGTPIRQDRMALLIGSFVNGIRYIELTGGSSAVPLLEPEAVIPVGRGGLEEFREARAEAHVDYTVEIVEQAEKAFEGNLGQALAEINQHKLQDQQSRVPGRRRFRPAWHTGPEASVGGEN